MTFATIWKTIGFVLRQLHDMNRFWLASILGDAHMASTDVPAPASYTSRLLQPILWQPNFFASIYRPFAWSLRCCYHQDQSFSGFLQVQYYQLFLLISSSFLQHPLLVLPSLANNNNCKEMCNKWHFHCDGIWNRVTSQTLHLVRLAILLRIVDKDLDLWKTHPIEEQMEMCIIQTMLLSEHNMPLFYDCFDFDFDGVLHWRLERYVYDRRHSRVMHSRQQASNHNWWLWAILWCNSWKMGQGMQQELTSAKWKRGI